MPKQNPKKQARKKPQEDLPDGSPAMERDKGIPVLLTVAEVANILRVKHATAWRYLDQGDLRGLKVGNVYRVRKNEVLNFIAKRELEHEEKIARQAEAGNG
jgi:excisionase family DNA binding protein